jgi:hypothetical protein
MIPGLKKLTEVNDGWVCHFTAVYQFKGLFRLIAVAVAVIHPAHTKNVLN